MKLFCCYAFWTKRDSSLREISAVSQFRDKQVGEGCLTLLDKSLTIQNAKPALCHFQTECLPAFIHL